MKVFSLSIILGILIISLVGVTPVVDAKNDTKSPGKPPRTIEQSTVVDPNVTVTLCVMSGEISVRGWEKNEIRARSTDVGKIEFRRIDKMKDSSKPASRIDVMILDQSGQMGTKDCQAVADVELDVPQGATVQVQTRDGDISIIGVAAAYAGSQNGDITIERAARLVEAGSVGGNISLKDSSGRVNLSSAGGGVEAVNIRSSDPEDSFEVGTVSGDIQLERVGNTRVVAKTVNGNVTMTGPLAASGRYGFTTMSGDVILTLPANASFQLSAKISQSKEIVSEFPLTYTADASNPVAPMPKPPAPAGLPPKGPAPKPQPAPKGGPTIAPIIVKPVVVPYTLRRINAVYGSGDAVIYVASFGGTLRLHKK
jgi:hypothetical protein